MFFMFKRAPVFLPKTNVNCSFCHLVYNYTVIIANDAQYLYRHSGWHLWSTLCIDQMRHIRIKMQFLSSFSYKFLTVLLKCKYNFTQAVLQGQQLWGLRTAAPLQLFP